MTRGTLDGFSALPEGPEIVKLTPRIDLRRYGRFAGKVDTLWNDLIWLEHTLPRKLRQCGADLFHAPYLHLPGKLEIPWVVHLHDFYMKRSPGSFTKWSVQQYEKSEKQLENARAIFCDSHFTKAELFHFHPQMRAKPVTVTPLAPDKIFWPRGEDVIKDVKKKHHIDGEYFLWVGTVESRKNLLFLLKLFHEQIVQKNVRLVVVGQDGWFADYVSQVNDVISEDDRILRLNYVDSEDLACLYSGALAMLFPSIYEGFGLPVLESMVCGCPVIASRGSSLDEVCGAQGLQVDADDREGWVKAIRERIDTGPCSADEKERILQWAQSFRWQTTAEIIYKVYCDVLS